MFMIVGLAPGLVQQVDPDLPVLSINVTGEERKSATSQPAPKTEVLQRSVFDLG
jgi:hypothetical protein